MSTIEDARKGLMDALRVIDGLNVYDKWPDKVNFPGCMIKRGSGNYLVEQVSLSTDVDFTIVVADRVTDREETILDPYVEQEGPKSIKAALEIDHTLGRRVDYVVVTGFDDPGTETVSGVTAWTQGINVQVAL